MSSIIVSVAKGISTMGIIRRELDRIESETGFRPEDWMAEIHDIAFVENTDGPYFDFEGFEMQVSCDADTYIEFVKENYADGIRVAKGGKV